MASVSEILKKAREHERKGEWEAAASEYRLLQEMEPCPPIAFNLMGDLFHRKGDGDEAFRWYEEAVDRYAGEGLFGNAIGVCRKILRSFPGRVEILEQLGGLFFSQGLAREAVKHYLSFATRMAERRDAEALLRVAGHVREILPDDGAVRESLGDLFLSLSLPEEGSEEFRAAAGAFGRTGKVEERRRVEAKLAEAARAAKKDPLSLMDGGDPSLGLTTAEDPVRPEPAGTFETFEPLDHSRAEPIHREETPAGGEEPGDVCLPEPSDPAPLPLPEESAPGDLEMLSPGEGDPPPADPAAAVAPAGGEDLVPVDEILRDFQNGVEKIIDEGDHQSHYDMGMSYKEMGLFEEALREFELAARSPELRASCDEMRGAVLLELDRPDECAALLRVLVARGEGDLAGIRFLLGRAYEKLGRNDLALREYHAVERENPGFRDVRERIAQMSG